MDSYYHENSNRSSWPHACRDQDKHSKDFGVDISYFRSWKAKELTLEKYTEVGRSLIHNYHLRNTTTGSYPAGTRLVHEADGSFLRFSWAFDLVVVTTRVIEGGYYACTEAI